MATKNTLNALLTRGIDTVTASRLVSENYTIQDLQLKTLDELVSLGISKLQAGHLLDRRPPIPEDIFLKVLHDSKWVCCICRDKNLGIIVHHIVKWSKSKRHYYDNLAVLCLHHHDEAHTKKELTLMLPPDRIKKVRDIWYKQVLSQDNSVINNAVIKTDPTETNGKPKHNIETVEELISSIRSNTTIRLKKGRYNLSDIAKFNGNKNITWNPVFNGYEPQINDVENLKIIGEEGTELVIDPSYSWVMKFANCKQISLEKVTCGHTSPGYCTGGVLMFDNCKDVMIKECDLYGCGTYGITIKNSSDFTIHKSIIRECTYGIAQFFNAKNVLFRDSQFFECREFGLITAKELCQDINFLRCRFENNYVSWDDHSFIDTDSTCKNIIIEYSQIHNNNVSKWVNIDGVVVTRHNEYLKNKFRVPEDVWWYDGK